MKLPKAVAVAKHSAARGVSLGEYGIILASVGVLCLMAVSLLGNSIAGLLGQNGMAGEFAKNPIFNAGTANDGPATQPPNQQQAGGTPGSLHDGTVALEGSGYMVWRKNPDTGELEMVITNGSGQQDANATSVNGEHWNQNGSMLLARELRAIADKYPPDSPQYDWYYQLANFGYYNAGVQGLLNGVVVAEFDRLGEAHNENRPPYSPTDGVRDLKRYQDQIKRLLETAPPEVRTSADFAAARAFAADLYNISQTQLQKSTAEGIIPSAEPVEGRTSMANTYDQVVNEHTLVEGARRTLNDNGLGNTSVRMALTDAVALDDIAHGG